MTHLSTTADAEPPSPFGAVTGALLIERATKYGNERAEEAAAILAQLEEQRQRQLASDRRSARALASDALAKHLGITDPIGDRTVKIYTELDELDDTDDAPLFGKIRMALCPRDSGVPVRVAFIVLHGADGTRLALKYDGDANAKLVIYDDNDERQHNTTVLSPTNLAERLIAPAPDLEADE